MSSPSLRRSSRKRTPTDPEEAEEELFLQEALRMIEEAEKEAANHCEGTFMRIFTVFE